MRWIGWVIVIVVLAAMSFARLTDDKERRGRDPDTAPRVGESPDSHRPLGRAADTNALGVPARRESL